MGHETAKNTGASCGPQSELGSPKRVLEEIELLAEMAQADVVCLGCLNDHLEAALVEVRRAIEQRHRAPGGCPLFMTSRCARSAPCMAVRAALNLEGERKSA
ncbi:MAG TPA: hypothetical protein VMI31_05690 [Fimbriimonadaceae bacterium]|nr:hypothetical protein [Fimbriimonadaceae bacterium]